MTGPYKIGTLARLTGFSPALLRAWERRFGLITPQRGGGRQRVYGDDDLAVLRRVRTLVDDGRAIGEIAAQGRASLLSGARRGSPPDSDQPAAGSDDLIGHIVSAALALDARGLDASMDQAFATHAADRAVTDVIVPSAIRIGDLWEAGQCSIASEHLASNRFLLRLGRLLDSAQPASAAAPHVMAACYPEERHELGLLVVAWHLARHGVRVEYLGSTMPLEDLASACRASRPAALLLSVTRRPAFRRHQRALARLFAHVPERVYVGGQGVPSPAPAARRIVILQRSPLTAVVERIVSDLGQVPGRRR